MNKLSGCSQKNNKLFAVVLFIIVTVLYIHHAAFIFKHTKNDDYLYKSDYSIFYRSAQLYFSGYSIYEPAKAKLEQNSRNHNIIIPDGNLNPPFFTVFVLALGKFKFNISFAIWLGLSVLAGLIGVYLLQRIEGKRNFFTPATLNIYTAFLAYFPVFISFKAGQLGLFLLPLCVLFWFYSRRRQDFSAGILLGTLIGVKLFFGLFLVFFLVQRRWFLLIYTLITLLVGVVISSLLFGKYAYLDYYYTLQQAVWFVQNWNAAIYGYLFRLIGIVGKGILVSQLIHYVTVTYYSISCLIVGLLIWMAWPQQRPCKKQYDLSFAFTLTACLYLSPLGWNYYFPILLIALYIILRLARRTYYTKLIYILTGISLLFSAVPLNLIRHPERLSKIDNLFWSSINFYALSLLLVIIVLLKLTIKKNSLIASQMRDYYLKNFRLYSYSFLAFFALFPANLVGKCIALTLYT